MEIVNSNFEVDERYVGRTNGVILEVTYKKRVPTRFREFSGSNPWYIDRERVPYAFAEVIGFLDVSTGKVYEVGLETAKRLLLDKMPIAR